MAARRSRWRKPRCWYNSPLPRAPRWSRPSAARKRRLSREDRAPRQSTARRRLTVVDTAQLPELWPDTARRVTEVLRRTAGGGLTPLVGRTYPLTEAATAHAGIEARRVTGKRHRPLRTPPRSR
ncbi:zinc-binding dehydrogenase [Amycolatopsis sp. YIM 10]|uniref:zinc-binding dehydrogenase n=1 Tax=Amycolatopsis sp. YIM 10 TaxID=2653857 RepID=UPI001D13B398|nr:zinc-binding dehydrogenase [Amycolatopsis sp. YIM 10]